jgi:glycosyltransferase involved in cell wall biosynthesis
MRLLIVTQTVDKKDPILGFFHRWIEEFGEQCDRVIVIGQSTGEYNFEAQITVASLKKEEGNSRFAQILRFWRLCLHHRGSYDHVFVHMTPIWVVLGFPAWFLLRKRVYLWYEARGDRWPLRIALRFVRKVFSASTHGMPVATSKSVITGHGIDTSQFFLGTGAREKGSLIAVGRITAAKHPEVLLGCLQHLPPSFHLTFAGHTRTPDDKKLLESLRRIISKENLADRVFFREYSQDEVIKILQKAEMFIHASETSLDKALLEAMACGCLVVSSAESAASVLPSMCRTSPQKMSETVKHLLALPVSQRQALREELRKRVVENHSLPKLVERLVKEMAK